jgi:N-acetylglucosaminyl-diphospho-decaprenol L-rhamnosyltransferase
MFVVMTRTLDCSVIIPAYNRWEYTRACLEGIFNSNARSAEVILIDNGSKDETVSELRHFSDITVLKNPTNEGCAKAWNAGLKVSSGTKWKIFLNNDVLLNAWSLSGLIDAGERLGLGVVCPAMWQGKLDYDLEGISTKLRDTLKDMPRFGFLHGVCFGVRNDVFDKVGLFDERFVLGQYEDTDFFRRIKLAGFACATVSESFLHHFGSVTQLALRDEGATDYAKENQRYFRQKWRLGWLKRKIEKLYLLAQIRKMERRERKATGCVMIR